MHKAYHTAHNFVFHESNNVFKCKCIWNKQMLNE